MLLVLAVIIFGIDNFLGSECNLNSDPVLFPLYLVAGDGYSFIAICFTWAILACDYGAYCIDDVFEAHG